MTNFPARQGTTDAYTGECDAVLAQRFLNHDSGAMTALVGRYYEVVFQVCFRILGHRQDAEDATQETFTRLAKYLHRWDPTRPLKPWLVTIAGNRCRTQMAKHRSVGELSLAAEPISRSSDEQQAAEALREEVTLALDQIPGRHRHAFELFHQHELSYAEIAAQMQAPVGSVKTWVHRARVALIEQLHRRDVVTDTDVTRKQVAGNASKNGSQRRAAPKSNSEVAS